MSNPNKKLYFTAGPAKIPEEVMKKVQEELLDYNGLGIGVAEMSHRSKHFDAIIVEAEQNLRTLLQVPESYAVLFMHGGANSQFDSVPMNLCSELDKCSADYLITGQWSSKAAKAATKYVKVIQRDFKKDGQYLNEPVKSELSDEPGVCYRYYCDNETIQGVEFSYVPESSNGNVPLVCDMTSNFLSRPVDVSKFGCIFAGAQKNCGIAGLVIVIVRKSLIGKQMRITPTIQNYQLMSDERSLYNTPQTFGIYVANLCFKWMLDRGGLEAMDKFCRQKSNIIYDTIDNSNGFYSNPIAKECRSRTNVVILIRDRKLEADFIKEAEASNLFELKGHRSVGGLRASLYHGVTLEDVQRLAKFMVDFQARHSGC